VDTWSAADFQRLHDRLEVEIADLRAVVATEVELEVTYALTGIVAPQYVTPYAERTELRPLPPDHPLARRQPWSPWDLEETW
jgi:hypothetical protein